MILRHCKDLCAETNAGYPPGVEPDDCNVECDNEQQNLDIANQSYQSCQGQIIEINRTEILDNRTEILDNKIEAQRLQI